MKKRGLCALLMATILVMCMAGALAEETGSCETHSWSNGVCTVCGAVCSHENREYNNKGTQKNTTFEDNGDGTHTRSFDVYHYYVCTVCGDIEERYIERGYEDEEHVWNSDGTCVCGAVKPCEHVWSNGVCTKCGEVCSHVNREYNNKGTQKNTVYVDNGNGTHTRTFDVYHYYVCTVCGDVEERYIEQGTETEEHVWNSDDTCACGAVKPCEHVWSNGVCTKCGEVCSHVNREYNNKGTQKNTTFEDNGDGTHTRSFEVYHYYVCTVCGDIEERYIERGYEDEEHVWETDDTCACGAVKPCEHVWSDGVCTVCGEECSHDWSNKDGVCAICGMACPGHQYQETGSDSETSYTQLNETQHNEKVTYYKELTCSVCGHTDKQVDHEETGLKNHAWKDGECTACGYECLHPMTMLTFNAEESWEEPLPSVVENESTHTDHYILHDVLDCACGKQVMPAAHEGSAPNKPHIWSNGKCTACGYECQHPASMLTFREEKTATLETVTNESMHTLTYGYYNVYDCACGKEVQELVKTETGSQPHTWSDGECTTCGYECLHPMTMLTYNADKSWDEPLPSVADDDSTHTDHYIIHDVFDCACGKEFAAPASEGSAPGKPHSYTDGVCADCGHVCTHSSVETDGDPIRTDGEAEYVNEEVHIQHYTYEQMMKCALCGSKVQSLSGSGRDGSVLHVYVNDVCVCGAKKPAAPLDDDDSTGGGSTGGNGGNGGGNYTGAVQEPETDEEFVFEQTEQAPKPAMVEKLVETIAEAEASGSEVKVEVVGAQQVMTETEYEQLKTLPVQEQVLVTLASIGFEEVVSAAVETMSDVALSDDALKLMDTVSARMTEMSAEEREQMQAKLTEYFPMREIEVGGVTYPYFVMELQVEVDGVLTIQRYGFRMDENGEWIFVMLSEQ